MNYFDDDEGEQKPTEGMEDHSEGGEENTFLVNKEVMPEAKPGDMFEVRVVRAMEDQLECVAMPKEEKKEEPMPEGGDGKEEMAPAGNSLMD